MQRTLLGLVLAAVAAGAAAQTKLPFRLNWTASGEHAAYFVARDKGFYRDEGLDVEILDGSAPPGPLSQVEVRTLFMRDIS